MEPAELPRRGISRFQVNSSAACGAFTVCAAAASVHFRNLVVTPKGHPKGGGAPLRLPAPRHHPGASCLCDSFSDTSRRWSHATGDFSCLAPGAQRPVLGVHPRRGACECLGVTAAWRSPRAHSAAGQPLSHRFRRWPLLLGHARARVCLSPWFQFFGITSWNGIVGSHDNAAFNFARSHQTVPPCLHGPAFPRLRRSPERSPCARGERASR